VAEIGEQLINAAVVLLGIGCLLYYEWKRKNNRR
jgi:hypothetical protein